MANGIPDVRGLFQNIQTPEEVQATIAEERAERLRGTSGFFRLGAALGQFTKERRLARGETTFLGRPIRRDPRIERSEKQQQWMLQVQEEARERNISISANPLDFANMAAAKATEMGLGREAMLALQQGQIFEAVRLEAEGKKASTELTRSQTGAIVDERDAVRALAEERRANAALLRARAKDPNFGDDEQLTEAERQAALFSDLGEIANKMADPNWVPTRADVVRARQARFELTRGAVDPAKAATDPNIIAFDNMIQEMTDRVDLDVQLKAIEKAATPEAKKQRGEKVKAATKRVQERVRATVRRPRPTRRPELERGLVSRQQLSDEELDVLKDRLGQGSGLLRKLIGGETFEQRQVTREQQRRER